MNELYNFFFNYSFSDLSILELECDFNMLNHGGFLKNEILYLNYNFVL